MWIQERLAANRRVATERTAIVDSALRHARCAAYALGIVRHIRSFSQELLDLRDAFYLGFGCHFGPSLKLLRLLSTSVKNRDDGHKATQSKLRAMSTTRSTQQRRVKRALIGDRPPALRQRKCRSYSVRTCRALLFCEQVREVPQIDTRPRRIARRTASVRFTAPGFPAIAAT